jgi:hypothetical protein
MYQNGEVFTNPAYSRIVGVIGVWNEGELSTAPGGRMLVSNAPVTPLSSTAAAAPIIPLGDQKKVQDNINVISKGSRRRSSTPPASCR